MQPFCRRLCVPHRRIATPVALGRSRMAAAFTWLALIGVCSTAAAGGYQGGQVQAGPTVRCEFRAFAGTEEVTSETRIRVSPAGVSAQGVSIEPRVPAALPPGLYDAQAVRMQEDRVVAIRRVERLAIVKGPDEGDLHLEVLNFDPRFGALQIRSAAAGRLRAFSAFAYDPASREQPLGVSLQGEAYALLVLPGGIYDIRIQATGAAEMPRRPDLWLLGVEVQADRSRIRLLPPDWGRAAASRRR